MGMVSDMKRFTNDGYGLEAIEDQSFTDNVTGKTYHVDCFNEIIELLNKESERADRNAELCTDEGLLKLEWEKSIYERFSKETLRILEKYEIDSLEKLDQILFHQKKW